MTRNIAGLAVVTAFALVVPSSARAQQPKREVGFFDVSFGASLPVEDSITTTAEFPKFSETATSKVKYSFPRASLIDIGGGVFFTDKLGAGLSVSFGKSEDAAELFVNVPHPLFFNSHASDTAKTDEKLQKEETAIHMSFIGKVYENEHVRLRVYGGPSYFSVKGDAVSEIHYSQEYQLFGRGNSVDINAYDTVKAEGSAWGYHAGADLAYFFTRNVGIGGFARYSAGTATIENDEVLADEPVDLKVGGFQAGGGLRIRF